MGLLNAWRSSRFRRRWMTEDEVVTDQIENGRAPDATLDQVGVPGQDIGFAGSPIHPRGGSGYGTGDPNSPGWAGWGASGGSC